MDKSAFDALNPYQSPLGAGRDVSNSLTGYSVVSVPNGWLGFSKRDALLKLLQKHGDQGDRLIASCTESSVRFHFVFKSPESTQIGTQKYSYRLVPVPRVKSLSKTTSGTLTQFMASHYPDLEAGWVPVAHISNNQLVLTKAEDLSLEYKFDEYLIAHVPPVWWRTLFGFSYLKIIGQELAEIATNGYEVITYIGEDRYLLGKREAHSGDMCSNYQMVFIGSILGVLLRGYAKSCEKRLKQMSDQGWELVTCNYSGLLLKKQNPSVSPTHNHGH